MIRFENWALALNRIVSFLWRNDNKGPRNWKRACVKRRRRPSVCSVLSDCSPREIQLFNALTLEEMPRATCEAIVSSTNTLGQPATSILKLRKCPHSAIQSTALCLTNLLQSILVLYSLSHSCIVSFNCSTEKPIEQ